VRVIYLHGFASSPQSRKAIFFRERLGAVGVEVEIPDLEEGDFFGLTLTRQLRAVERAAGGRKVTLIGSSMGGYLAALYGARHEEVERIIALAPAFDFARLWRARLGEKALAEWEQRGWMETFHYGSGKMERIGWELYRDATGYEAYPACGQEALVIHGVNDQVVPVSQSREFVKRNRERARLVEVESGHELTDQMERLWREVSGFLGVSDR
jgi:pimeloyl-ACP methyl ester carboxylesterase